MKSRPYLIQPDQNGQPLIPIQPDEKRFSESWLQALIHNHPDLLPVDEIEPVFSPLTSIGREIPTRAGYIDNLLISRSGYPVIVETKLWRNPEARRPVIAQAIDYAGELSKWSFEQLDSAARPLHPGGLIDLIQQTFDLDPDELPDEDAIAKNLRLGRFLILVVGDRIQQSLVEMLHFINRYPHLATNVGLVELQAYTLSEQTGDVIVVPSLVARTEIVERSIVQVSLSPDLPYQLSVEQIKTEPEHSGRRPLTEEAFWEALQKQAPGAVVPARQILDHFSGFPEVVLKMRRSAVAARMNIPDSDQRLSLFLASTEGSLECWISTVILQIENAGLDPELGRKYKHELDSILNKKRGTLSIFNSLDKVNIEAFIEIVNNFIDAVLAASYSTEIKDSQ